MRTKSRPGRTSRPTARSSGAVVPVSCSRWRTRPRAPCPSNLVQSAFIALSSLALSARRSSVSRPRRSRARPAACGPSCPPRARPWPATPLVGLAAPGRRPRYSPVTRSYTATASWVSGSAARPRPRPPRPGRSRCAGPARWPARPAQRRACRASARRAPASRRQRCPDRERDQARPGVGEQQRQHAAASSQRRARPQPDGHESLTSRSPGGAPLLPA